MSALRIGTGTVIHTLLAAFGLSIIISESIVVFNIINYAGAIYLVYFGVKMFVEKSQFIPGNPGVNKPLKELNVYRDAVITNVLNPKVALFFIAFLPQFIDPVIQNTVLPFLTLGLTFTFTGTVWCLIQATFASVIFAKLQNNKRPLTYTNKICGTVLIALGIRVPFATKR
jgi:threonine/homoserine/homoserine lactone efflux protein